MPTDIVGTAGNQDFTSSIFIAGNKLFCLFPGIFMGKSKSDISVSPALSLRPKTGKFNNIRGKFPNFIKMTSGCNISILSLQNNQVANGNIFTPTFDRKARHDHALLLH